MVIFDILQQKTADKIPSSFRAPTLGASDKRRTVMNIKVKRLVTGILAAVTALSFAACSAETETTAPDGTETETAETDAATEATTGAVTTEGIVDKPHGDVIDAEPASSFRVSNVFSSNMVVQRGEFIRVWGSASPSDNGKKIMGEFMGMTAECLVEDGKWELTFTARLSASTELGNDMRIYGASKEFIFEDVLVGDVYMVIGQSNVAAPVAADPIGVSVIKEGDPIRLHYNSLSQTAGYPTRGTEEVCEELKNGSTWFIPTVANASNFTAIGYFFAHHFVELTEGKIPVGIIEIDGNGQPLGAFLPNEVAEKCKTDRFDSSKGYHVTTGVNADGGRYMYNHYMYPFERYAMAGIVWYQGESDCLAANFKKYNEAYVGMIEYMRSTHNLVNPSFPVYIVEFPTIYAQPANFRPTSGAPMWGYMDVGNIRAVMGALPLMLENAYMSVSNDLWADREFWNNLHPLCKYAQAERLANLAASVLENVKPLDEATGPIPVKIEFSEDKKTAVITYTNVGEGLTTSDGGTTVKGYVGAKNDYALFTKAELEATITAKDQVTIKSNRAIAGVAYNAITTYFYGIEINLCNSNGIPAAATFLYPEE